MLHKSDQYGNRLKAAGLATKLPQCLDRMYEVNVCKSFLDYGTGKGKLLEYIKENTNNPISIKGYDPAVQEFSEKPQGNYDIVTCLDVLEHVELNSIDNVLAEIASLTNNFCYLVIDLQPAVKTLEDGRNAHILLAPPDWWHNKISCYFSSYSTFPIYHRSGDKQKIAIFACNNRDMVGIMHQFAVKLNIFDLSLKGGVLEKRYQLMKKSH